MTARIALATCVATVIMMAFVPAHGQQPAPQHVQIPDVATLEGVPTIRIDTNEASTTRRILSQAEAGQRPLKVRVRGGRFYWASQGDRLLQLTSTGPFTYLAADPGSYIRLTRLNDKISYVEHVDMKELGSVTWWGELRIVVGP